jgi:hypothetical protein
MWLQRRFGVGGPVIFFRVSLCDNNLTAMFNNNFAMMQHHKYSLSDIENMIPWERDIYTALLVQWVAEENERIKKQNQG